MNRAGYGSALRRPSAGSTRSAARWVLLAALPLFFACREPSPPKAADDGLVGADSPPEPVRLREGQANIVLSYRDPDSGQFVTVESTSKVPEAARSSVVVVDLSLSPQARGSGRYVHVADLRKADPDGYYPVAVASRYGFEQSGRLSPAEGQAERAGEAPVVLYSASWCGVCRKARRLLGELGVPYVEKDIEASRAALEELARKAAEHGVRPGGVPVIDVKGTLLQGLDVARLKDLLREKGFLSG